MLCKRGCEAYLGKLRDFRHNLAPKSHKILRWSYRWLWSYDIFLCLDAGWPMAIALKLVAEETATAAPQPALHATAAQLYRGLDANSRTTLMWQRSEEHTS